MDLKQATVLQISDVRDCKTDRNFKAGSHLAGKGPSYPKVGGTVRARISAAAATLGKSQVSQIGHLTLGSMIKTDKVEVLNC
jgi:hypothetical protein